MRVGRESYPEFGDVYQRQGEVDGFLENYEFLANVFSKDVRKFD